MKGMNEENRGTQKRGKGQVEQKTKGRKKKKKTKGKKIRREKNEGGIGVSIIRKKKDRKPTQT